MAVTNADILGWFNANPGADDALIARTMQEAGVSPARLAEVTGTPVAEVNARFEAATKQSTPSVPAPVVNTVIPTPTKVVGGPVQELPPVPSNITPQDPLIDLYQKTLGRTPSQAEIDSWGFGSTIDQNELNRFLGAARNEAVNTMPSVSASANIAKQILAQGTTGKWSGEGYGSAEKNALDMGTILAGIGITDISQFGQIQKEVPTYSYDENGNAVQTGTEVVTTYGNKLTGQEVPNTYSERQTGNAFGGTYAGKGNTGYRVEFDAQGKPLFYTTGASSSDVPSWVKPALVLGGAHLGLDAAGLLGGLGTAGATGLTAAEAAGLGLTASEAASLGLSASEFAAAGGGAGLLGATAGLGDLGTMGAFGEGALPAVIPAETVAGMGAGTGLLAGAGGLGLSTAGAGLGAAGTGAGLTGAGLGSSLAGVSTGVGAGLGGTLAGLSTGVGTGLATGVGTGLGTAAGAGLGSLISSGLTLGSGLLQSQTSKEAALAAQQRIDAETAAAKQAAAFRPVGMTTRFGTSQYQVDPVTGQITSAGYTLSPEAKAQQDRFMALSNAGLTQAEQAQTQFAPLQTGAQRLFGLGNQYLAQSPEDVAKNYLAQQMALLQPGRELELANLQAKLQQQGRGGLAVSQGGNYGATTPELQALYNARAMQEAQLAAQAQQAGQQQVTFGAGLLGQGTTAMGNYYAGQQAAYAPYTTALGQVQGLEAAGQQPFTMGAALGQQAAQAGANVGQLGLTGAKLSTALATSDAATNNPYAMLLGGLGGSTALGTAAGNYLGGLFS